MRFKNDNDNKYRVNFMRATEELLDKLTVEDFIEYLENNAELEDDEQQEYLDGKVAHCKAYDLHEQDSKLHKEFLVTEDGRVFYWVSLLEKAELVDATDWENEEVQVTLTNSQWSWLSTYLLMTTNYRKSELEAWQSLSKEVDEQTGKPKFENAAGNAQFWQEMSELIEKIIAKVDGRNY